MNNQQDAEQSRPRDQCLVAINAYTFHALRALMLGNESDYVAQIQNLAQACAEAINIHRILPAQILTLIEGRIAATHGQHLTVVIAKIQTLQTQQRDLDGNQFFNAAAETALKGQIDSLNNYRKTPIADLQKILVTDCFVRANRGYQTNVDAALIHEYEPENLEQPNIVSDNG